MDAGGEPCSLPAAPSSADMWPLYADLPALVNDVDLAVVGRPVGSALQPPEPDTAAGVVLTTVQVDRVIYGADPGAAVVVEHGQGAMEDGGQLRRLVSYGLDLCDLGTDQVLLFLEPTSDPSVFSIPFEGWARIGGETIVGSFWGPRDTLFKDYSTASLLVAAVRQIANEHQAQGLLKGTLQCRQTRVSQTWVSVGICPGDSFNLYVALGLASASRAQVTLTDPGASDYLVGTSMALGVGLSSLLNTLDLQVTAEPSGPVPEDLVSISFVNAEVADGPGSLLLWYSPSAGIIQMPQTGGQFAAPPDFQRAIAPFVSVAAGQE